VSNDRAGFFDLAWAHARNCGWQQTEDQTGDMGASRELSLLQELTEPFHGVCLSVDCTETYRYAKKHHLSVFLSLLHHSLVALHQVLNLKTRIVGDAVWSYEQIDVGSAVERENGTIGLGHYQFRPQIDEFVREAAIEVDQVRQRDDIEFGPNPPWLFTKTIPPDTAALIHSLDIHRRLDRGMTH
jgi:chloramphenicol O-acetyltransferase type A